MPFPMFEFQKDEARLFLKTSINLFGIKLSDLMASGKEEKKEAKDWGSLPSPPFDFCVEVPDEVGGEHLHHFVLDSKLYLARGGLVNLWHRLKYLDGMWPSDPKNKRIRVMGSGTADVEEYEVPDCIPWCKIYEFDMDNKQLIEVAAADSNSIPSVLTPYHPSFLGNILGHPDVYCLVYRDLGRPKLEGLWVLSSSSSSTQRLWKRLPSPPVLNRNFTSVLCDCFVVQGKVFLRVYERAGKGALFSFDPTTTKWARVDYDVMASFAIDSDTSSPELSFSFPLVTLLLNNRTVGLSCLTDVDPDDYRETNVDPDDYGKPPQGLVSLPAFLLNNQNGAGLRYRSLDECFDGIRPSIFYVTNSHVGLVDLGNGMVCALLYAYTPCHDDYRSPVLCLSVFTLSMVEPAISIGTGTEAPRKKREDLSVEVHVKRAFTMKEYDRRYTWLLDPFVFTPKT